MSINVRSGRYRPEGAKGLSLGFEPKEHVHTTTRPVRAEDVSDGISFFLAIHLYETDLPPLRGGRVLEPITWG